MSDKPNPAVISAAATQAIKQDNIGAPPPEDERPVWDGRPSWKAAYPRFILMLVWVAAVSALAVFLPSDFLRVGVTGISITVGLMLVGVLYLLWGVIYGRFNIHFRLTTQRLFLEKGIFGKVVDQTELVRVEDVQFRQSFYQRSMGIGNVELYSTDRSDGEIILRNVDEPRNVAEQVRNSVMKRRGRTVFVENV